MFCDKCWSDASLRAFMSSSDTTSEYEKLLEERKENPCSPEKRCGEMHLVLSWKNGMRHCVCGKVWE